MDNKLVLGVDGGGTKTACAVADARGNVLGFGAAGPSNHLRGPGGAQEAAQAVRRGAEEALAQARKAGHLGCDDLSRISVACLALAGVGLSGVSDRMMNAARTALPIGDIVLENDAVAALAGANGRAEGVVVIAGTGSIAVAISPDGRRGRAGGWGYRIGDEGSGYDIAVRGLTAVSRAHDGRGPATSLVDAAMKHFGLESPDDLRSVLYRDGPGSACALRDIASFCPAVVHEALGGDRVAMDIMEHAGRELAAAAWAAARSVGMPEAQFAVAPCGSAFMAGEVLIDPFRAELGRLTPGARVAEPMFPPVIGALILAIKRLDRLDPGGRVIENLQRSWKKAESRKVGEHA